VAVGPHQRILLVIPKCQKLQILRLNTKFGKMAEDDKN
jgi:hypothetical protein